ncbi:MAG: hypothetical protein CME06_06985 [Gemmatimonadetes bacterium]|nr:hypothetical protein [Gemmatimonadota bacterium]
MSDAKIVQLQATVDRIEEGRAVIAVLGGGEMLLPVERLPEGAGEGACLTMRVERDSDREVELRGKTADLQQRLLEMTREGEDRDGAS